MSSDDEKKLEPRKVIIKLDDGSIIKGSVNLLSEQSEDKGTFFNRISDLFIHGKSPFVVVFDCTVSAGQQKVLVVNKNKIIWIAPVS
jgi:hypothetical protein